MTSTNLVVMISGADVPGILSGITEAFDRPGVKLLDIEQAVTHGLLSLSIVVQVDGEESRAQELIKDMLFKAKELGITMDYKFIKDAVRLRSSAQRFAITLMSADLQPKHLGAMAQILAKKKVNIDSIRKLSEGGISCVELIVYTNSVIDLSALKTDLLKTAAKFPQLDVAVQRENLYRRSKRLVVMDMDSTLIQVEVIDELAKRAGVGAEVSKITEQAMNGEIDYDESLRRRVALLKGLSEDELRATADEIPLTPGAEVLIQTLKRLGYRIALISGGFSYFGEKFKNMLGMHYVYTNELEIRDGKVTGNLRGAIVNAQRKADLLELIAQQEGVPLESTIAIGDGANDILMLKKAGLGIAFNAKKKTREAASASINQRTLASILYLLGITDKDVQDVAH